MTRTSRIGRWIAPGAGLLTATFGVLVLIVGEFTESLDGRPAPSPAVSALVRPDARVARGEPAPRPRVEPTLPRVVEAAPVGAAAAESRAPSRVVETAAVLDASPVVTELALARTLEERLQIVERVARDLPAADAAVTLVGLLDSRLPGDAYEEEALRLSVLGRLGALSGGPVDAALVARLDPERPRPERLLALDALARRPYVGRAEVAAIAARDHDTVVQRKARLALQR